MASNDYNLYRVYRTVLTMLKKRGLDNVPALMSYDEFKDIPRNNLTIKIPGNILVYFPDEDKIGVKTIRSCKTEMAESSIKRAILVVRESITSFAKKYEIESSDEIEIFKESQLYFDITEHELVPKHEKLSEQEKKELLERLSIKEINLPKLLKTDAVSRFYGYHKADVIKITRPSETAGTYVSYRIVI
jgi:DNA-directed RNA polymerase I, II, and III subunit RPABC1